MFKPPHRFDAVLVAAVAFLRIQGLSVRKVAQQIKRLGLVRKASPATVHRIMKQAKKDLDLKSRLTFDYTRLSAKVHRAALDLLAPLQIDDVVKRVAPPGQACRVCVIPEDAATPASVRAFGFMAAQVLLPHLMEAKNLGVAWGRLVNALVDGLAQSLREPVCGPGGKYQALYPIPVVGEPMHVATTMHEYSSTVLATRMAEMLNRQKVSVPSLAGVPAYLPRNGGRHVRGVLRKFFTSMPGYSGFGGKGGLFSSLDAIVTGAGVLGKVVDTSPGVFLNERVIAEEMKRDAMESLVYGDLAGVLIPKRGLPATDAAKVAMLNEGWTGLGLADIQRCAKKANALGRGGVFLIANDARKARLVYEIVRLGLVNYLVIDVGLANEFSAIARAGGR